METSC